MLALRAPVSVRLPHLFYASISTPVGFELAQQFWSDIEIDASTGRWIALMTDADPLTGVDKNTTNPSELSLDVGSTGFEFSVIGTVAWAQDGQQEFTSEPFTLSLTIVSINFTLNDAVLSGTIDEDVVTGLSRWHGQLTLGSLFYSTPSLEKTYYDDRLARAGGLRTLQPRLQSTAASTA